jgi:hypothetical protein
VTATRTVWQQPQSRHYRRYTDPERFPYVVRWGNARLTSPAMRRTYVGARITAAVWRLVGRGHVFIEERTGLAS